MRTDDAREAMDDCGGGQICAARPESAYEMTTIHSTPTIERLEQLARSERREALEEIVVAHFKTALLMTDDEDLPTEESFFNLGFTSLLVSDIKQRLETMLGCAISANVLFNSPTLERLIAHLTDEVLVDLFAVPT
jgi:acyl carrier protein